MAVKKLKTRAAGERGSYLELQIAPGHVEYFEADETLRNWLKDLKGLNLSTSGATGTNFEQHGRSQINTHTAEVYAELKSTLSPDKIANNRTLAQESASRILQSNRIIVPGTKDAALVARLTEIDPMAADYARMLITGIDAIYLEKTGQVDAPTLNRSASLAAFAVAADMFGIAAGYDEVRKDAEESAKLKNIAAKELKSIVERAGDEFKKLEDARKKLDNLASAYEEKVKTDAAVSYWEAKKSEHQSEASSSLATLLRFAKGAVLSGLLLVISLAIFAGKLDEVPFWAVVTVAMVTLGSVWAGRVLVGLFLRQRALTDDAAERAVMVKTFVALVAEGMAGREQASILLKSIFRPSVGGSGYEDRSPSLPQEILAKLATGGKDVK